MTTLKAHFDGKRSLVLDEPADLPVGTPLRVHVEPAPPLEEHVPGGPDDPLIRMLDLAVDAGIRDLAENADHYLYGHPKQSDQPDEQ